MGPARRSRRRWIAAGAVGAVVVLGGVLWVRSLLRNPAWLVERAVCLTHQRALGIGLALYTQDNGDRLPPCSQWQPAVKGYVNMAYHPFDCPGTRTGRWGIGLNRGLGGADLMAVEAPERIVMLFDCRDEGPGASGGPTDLVYRHGVSACVALADGHAQFVKRNQPHHPLEWRVRIGKEPPH